MPNSVNQRRISISAQTYAALVARAGEHHLPPAFLADQLLAAALEPEGDATAAKVLRQLAAPYTAPAPVPADLAQPFTPRPARPCSARETRLGRDKPAPRALPIR